jgi:hypothetical protein
VDGVRAADGRATSFGQSEVGDLARLHEFGDRPGNVFDGHIGVHTVLVEQVDPVRS